MKTEQRSRSVEPLDGVVLARCVGLLLSLSTVGFAYVENEQHSVMVNGGRCAAGWNVGETLGACSCGRRLLGREAWGASKRDGVGLCGRAFPGHRSPSVGSFDAFIFGPP